MSELTTSESHDGTGSGDRDVVFSFGHPLDGMHWHDHARLLVLRGLCKDHAGAADGDLDYTETRPSGVIIPVVSWRYGS